MTVADKAALPGPELAEDLIAVARRGALPQPLERRLTMCLAASDSLRCLDQVGHDFDQMQTALASDKADTEGLVALARHRYAKGHSARGWRMPAVGWLAAVGVSLLALGAAAAIGGLGLRVTSTAVSVAASTTVAKTAGQERKPSEHTPASPGAGPADTPVSQPSAAAPAPALAGLNPVISSPRSALKIDPVRPAESLPVSSEPASSTALFSSANAARRRGEHRLAMSLYRELQSSFPASPETSLSHILLARLELGQGDAAAALTQFDAYLRQPREGSLTQEALQGKALALAALGRKDEETEVWRELLRRYPTSPYAASARKRLGANGKPE